MELRTTSMSVVLTDTDILTQHTQMCCYFLRHLHWKSSKHLYWWAFLEMGLHNSVVLIVLRDITSMKLQYVYSKDVLMQHPCTAVHIQASNPRRWAQEESNRYWRSIEATSQFGKERVSMELCQERNRESHQENSCQWEDVDSIRISNP